MPVKLRLRRQGRSKAAHYSVVAADVRSPRDGRYIEKIGYFDPLREPAHLYLDDEAAIRWLSNGAQPTHTVRDLLRHAGVTLKYALIKQGKTEEEVQKIFDRWYADKQKKKKRIMVRIDVHGKLLEELPEPAAPVAPKAEAAPAPVEEAPAAEEAAEDALEAVAEATTETIDAVAEAVKEAVEETVTEAKEEAAEAAAEATEEETKTEE